MQKPLKNNSLGHLFGDVASDLNKLTAIKTRKPRWSVAKLHALSANRHLRKTENKT